MSLSRFLIDSGLIIAVVFVAGVLIISNIIDFWEWSSQRKRNKREDKEDDI